MRLRIAALVSAAAAVIVAPAAYAGADKLLSELDDTFLGVFGPAAEGAVFTPDLALVGSDIIVAPPSVMVAVGSVQSQSTYRGVAGLSADKTTAWYAADLAAFEVGCGAAPCPPPPPPPAAEIHATVVYQKGDDGAWRPLVWDLATVVSGKDQAAAVKKAVMPGKMPTKIAAGAADAVKELEGTIGDPKRLARSVSARKDVVLYGSEAAERVVGGAAVAAKLQAWNLAFDVRDGESAGVNASKTVAWVAANLDSVSAAKGAKQTSVPYRVLFVYAKEGADWKLVSANFAYITGE